MIRPPQGQTQTMLHPSKDEMQRLLDVLKGQRTEFLPATRWLVLGRRLAESLLPEFVQEPDLERLLALVRWVKSQEPELLGTLTSLIAISPFAGRLEVESQLDLLADQAPTTWNHPAQVLFRPRRSFQELLTACEWRLEKPDGVYSKRRLQSVARKLGKALRLEAKARQRREQMQNHPNQTLDDAA